MTDLPNGPYNYRTVPASVPIVVEILAGRVLEAGDSYDRPLSNYHGIFTRLVEVTEPVEVKEGKVSDA